MIEIPWLRSDVAANIRNNFAFYFGYERFGLYAACVAAVIVLNCMAVKFFFAGEYRFSAGDRRFFFNRKDKSELAGAAALAFSFLLYALNLFSLELSVFGNYDQMVVNNILDMRRGLQPVFTSMRFNPAAGIDHNIIYGITHHYALIGGWVLLKQALCLWLLYRFFVFVSAARRLFMLAAVNFLPAVFWVNGIVYSEQNTLIFVLLSLTALQKYDGRHGLRQLLWFALWANLAIYTKETNIFVYFGILLYLVLAKVWAGKITLRSFLSPFKTVAGMPAEYILFWSMLLFSAGYLLLSNLLTDGAYVRHHHQELPTLLAAFFVPLMLWSAWQNGRIRSREEGTDRRELAEFVASVADRPAVFFVSGKDSDDLWKLECFDSALKYAVGGNDIRFKTDMEIPSAKRQILTGENYYGIRREAPAEGDYAVIRRNEEKRPENCGETVWQNRVYEVCRIKSKEREDKK